MNICVGSYAQRVLDERYCQIFILKELSTRNPVGCIEYSNGVIIQAKGPNNCLLENKEKQFIEKWIKAKNLVVNTHYL